MTSPADWYRGLRFLARKICGPRYREIGEDVVQAGALALLKAPPYDPAAGNLLGWVVTYSRWAMRLEAARSQFCNPSTGRKVRARGDVLPAAKGLSPTLRAKDAERARADARLTWWMIAPRVPTVQREAVVRHFLGEENFVELATATGITPPTAQYRVRQGIEKARTSCGRQ